MFQAQGAEEECQLLCRHQPLLTDASGLALNQESKERVLTAGRSSALQTLEDSCAKKETLPCRRCREVSQSFSQLTVLPSSALLSFTLPRWLTINPFFEESVWSPSLHYFPPMVPEAFWPLFKSPSALDNIPSSRRLQVLLLDMSWLCNIYWVLMRVWPGRFYADYMTDRRNILSMFQPSWFWLPGFEVKYPLFSFLLLGGLCLPFLSLLAVFAKVIAVTRFTGLLYLMSGF